MPTTPHDGLRSRTNLANVQGHAHTERRKAGKLSAWSAPRWKGPRALSAAVTLLARFHLPPQEAWLGVPGFQAEEPTALEVAAHPLGLGELTGNGRRTAALRTWSAPLFEDFHLAEGCHHSGGRETEWTSLSTGTVSQAIQAWEPHLRWRTATTAGPLLENLRGGALGTGSSPRSPSGSWAPSCSPRLKGRRALRSLSSIRDSR